MQANSIMIIVGKGELSITFVVIGKVAVSIITRPKYISSEGQKSAYFHGISQCLNTYKKYEQSEPKMSHFDSRNLICLVGIWNQ